MTSRFIHVFSLYKLYFSAVCSLCDFAVSNKCFCMSLGRYVHGAGRWHPQRKRDIVRIQ